MKTSLAASRALSLLALVCMSRAQAREPQVVRVEIQMNVVVERFGPASTVI